MNSVSTRRHFNRQLLAGASVLAAASVAACTGAAGTTTIAAILADIQKTCGFVTTWQSLAPVIISLVANFNAAAGAAATVAIDVATKVKDMVCGAVMTHAAAQTGALREAASVAGQTITIHVNGVPVKGELTTKRS